MLTITNLTKSYGGGKPAVDDLSLHVEPGDIYGFIGHNGAGKTTALRSIAGVITFDSGEILIDGKSVTEDPIGCKSSIAYIPDNPDIYEHLTGIQYLNFICDIFSVSKQNRDLRINKYAAAFELQNDLGDVISAYSHGMKQKLVLISALVHEPLLMLLDEPFVGLDPIASHTLKQIMGEMCREGRAFFFSTHVLDVAEKLCNKIAIIKNGKLIASGYTEEVRGQSSLEEIFLELTDNE